MAMTLTNEDLQAIGNLLDQKLEEKLDQKLEEKLERKFEEKLSPINSRLDRLESQVNALRTGQLEIKNELKNLKKKVDDTYQIALDAWGTSTENREWLESTVN